MSTDSLFTASPSSPAPRIIVFTFRLACPHPSPGDLASSGSCPLLEITKGRHALQWDGRKRTVRLADPPSGPPPPPRNASVDAAHPFPRIPTVQVLQFETGVNEFSLKPQS
ncbi:hypothetical protein CDAR_539211 [Caerostris darwini]|uniref:Uncharacterized protein n=1 Tax=Caerostris darwini TaxID=1538125 RepID=A0AAV4T4A8_9ARAC|nr:hypothetical protein CDAR_539211 [Caerostris darwini]